jgi:hypothetical protein
MGFANVIGEGFVAQHANARVEKGAGSGKVNMVGRRDHDRVNTIGPSGLGLCHLRKRPIASVLRQVPFSAALS